MVRRDHAKDPIVALTKTGFRIGDSEFDWNSVMTIRVFKLDLVTWDEIRFSFNLASGRTLEVSEEQPGFSEFVAELERRYPAAGGWQAKVVQPAFARNEVVLWQRS
jgi:hypothetical protein